MIALMFIAATMLAPEAEGAAVTREQNRLSIPQEIAPAVMPYFQCLMIAMNKEAGANSISSAEAARAAKERALTSCRTVRDEAKAATVEMLSRSNVETSKRDAFAEQTLTSIDHAHDNIAERLERNSQD